MSYRIESIDLFMRETPPARLTFVRGRQETLGKIPPRKPHPIGHVRLRLSDDSGRSAVGCSGDYFSIRWLDKRPDRSDSVRMRDLVAMVETARDHYLQEPGFRSPFRKWWECYPTILKAGREKGQEDLLSSFSSALMERSLIDAVCRIEGRSVFEAVQSDLLGFKPGDVHPELVSFDITNRIAARPRTRFFVRHTVGLADPLTSSDLTPELRVGDGEPETLEDSINRDGVSYFKIKLSGETEWDLDRLNRIWSIIPKTSHTALTLDANEAYQDLDQFAAFVERLEKESVGLFQHLLYIEQPLPRDLSLESAAGPVIRKLSERKPIIIDEAEGSTEVLGDALAMGYAGTSHKNCKGFFKSLVNLGLIEAANAGGRRSFLTGEDLMNVPTVPLQQDFASLGVLGIADCERNGHHYNFGLSMLSAKEKEHALKTHSDLYVERGGEGFLNIVEGQVVCGSLQRPGFGVSAEPDWASMIDLRTWVDQTYPE